MTLFSGWKFDTRTKLTLTFACVCKGRAAPSIEVIRSATIYAAELLGLAKQVGSLEKSKFADIIAVPGNPLEDPQVLEQAKFVMKGGVVVKPSPLQ